MPVRSLGWEDLLKECMATHSSIFARRIPRMEELSRLEPMGVHRVGHNGSDIALHPQMCESLPFQMGFQDTVE